MNKSEPKGNLLLERMPEGVVCPGQVIGMDAVRDWYVPGSM